MNRLIIATLALLALVGWTVPRMQVDERLRSGTSVYEVEGRQGWLIKQKIRFGPFYTNEVKRSWTKGYDYPFVVRFTGAREKLAFTIHGRAELSAQVHVAGKLKERDLTAFGKYFDINVYTQDVMAGSVAVQTGQPEPEHYDFFVTNLNRNPTQGEVGGHVRGPGLDATLRPVTHLDTGQRMLDVRYPGFEFLADNQAVAAVQTLNDGRVWLHDALPDRQQLIFAAVAASLLLRSDLEDHNDP